MNSALELALSAPCEDRALDFKRSFDSRCQREWLEIIKDIVAMANSGGGVLLIGVDDDGRTVGVESPLLLDPADITNKIYKYTECQFYDFRVVPAKRDGQSVFVIQIGAASVPIIFTKPGTYSLDSKSQDRVFSAGAVYFRHGAKSEPGNTHDLRHFFEQQLEATRKSWLDGIAKVVEAPAGARIAVLPPEVQHSPGPVATPIRIVDDPSAPAYYAMRVDDTHPYRQKEVIERVNEQLAGRRVINSHHIISIRRVHGVQKNIKFCYTLNFTSPRYSQEFIDWIADQFDKNERFFDEAKQQFDAIKAEARKVASDIL